MNHKYTDDSLAIHTDLYQINMAETYWEDNMHNQQYLRYSFVNFHSETGTLSLLV